MLFYTGDKMSVLFAFYGVTVTGRQHRTPAEQMFMVSVKGECSLLYVLLGFHDWVLCPERDGSLPCFLWLPG